MIGKVKLTREQADAIVQHQEATSNDIAILLDSHADGNPWCGKYEPFNGLSQADMARALLIGYEVEETFKRNNWVVDKINNNTSQILEIKGGLAILDDDKVWLYWEANGEELARKRNFSELRHATPEEIKAEKERRAWAKIGRKVNEFRVGDAYEYTDGNWGVVLSDGIVRSAKRFYKEGRIRGVLPAESFVNFEDGGSDD